MPNEFIIKNGFFSQGSSNITGSLTVTGGITGSLAGTVTSASYSITASYVDVSALPLVSPIGAYTTLTSSILSGTNITLPSGLTYVSSSTFEFLSVAVNGLLLRYNIDFIPTSTSSIQFNLTIPSGSEMSYRSYRRP